MVMGDEERIVQIMLNLQTNALKFTEAGSVTTIVTFEDEMLRIETKDTGIGISEQD